MVTVEQLRRGIAGYLDAEIAAKITGWQKWVFSAACAAYLAQLPSIMRKASESKYIAAMALMDSAGNVDVDKAYEYLRPAAAQCPAPISIPGMGTITLTESDVDTLYNYITHS